MPADPQQAQRDRGATAVEYALILAGIAGGIIAVVVLLSPQIADLYNRATTGW